MKVYIFLLLSCIFLSCTKKKPQHIKSVNQKVYYTKDSIPSKLLSVLSNHFKSEFSIANPDEKYNATDMLIDSLPSKQLLFISNEDKNWQMVYQQGGFGKYFVYVECKKVGDSILDVKKGETIQNIGNINNLNKLLLAKEIRLVSINN
mgnify:FL=1